MHKEIEEARALIDGMDSAITQHGIAKAAEMFPQEETGLAAFTLLRNLLALFDRMQKQPVVMIRETKIDGRWTNGMDGEPNYIERPEDSRMVRYRRELEGGNDAK